jgi:hypothetical protein
MISTAAAASITLTAAIFLTGAASGQVPMSPALAPPRPPIARKQPLTAPAPTKRASGAARSNGELTQDDLKQLDQMLQSLTPKERKQFTKALKQLSPEGRKQLVENMRRQQQGKGPSSHVAAPHVVKKSPPPLPRRLAF